jgi:hypothetical protein
MALLGWFISLVLLWVFIWRVTVFLLETNWWSIFTRRAFLCMPQAFLAPRLFSRTPSLVIQSLHIFIRIYEQVVFVSYLKTILFPLIQINWRSQIVWLICNIAATLRVFIWWGTAIFWRRWKWFERYWPLMVIYSLKAHTYVLAGKIK